ncbi:hypothetical protein NECAME_01768 [Necator americanus]|uniref:Uncharacterized protein n=1 Tax=Necator americanus TaxID=51031 RepID=W2TQR2_NECAM|nr:hypothetical protein NECAME_01768 [Necator americanus]ETN83461.1 hypothetical protein NECAME_01768 [Necator americanus]
MAILKRLDDEFRYEQNFLRTFSVEIPMEGDSDMYPFPSSEAGTILALEKQDGEHPSVWRRISRRSVRRQCVPQKTYSHLQRNCFGKFPATPFPFLIRSSILFLRLERNEETIREKDIGSLLYSRTFEVLSNFAILRIQL